MSDSPLLASIVVRARDEAPSLRRLLPLLARQECDGAFEILLLDNESRDGSAKLAAAYGVRCHTIPRGAFNYSSALNLGAELAQGTFLVHLSAHCFPQTKTWLAQLLAPLRLEASVIGSYGRQWMNPATSPFEAQGNDELFPPHPHPQLVAFSNANCAIRREMVLKHPFNPVVGILEDHLFYLELMQQGRFVYVPGALVHHEHEQFSWRYYLRRWRREGRAFYFISEHRGLPTPFRPDPLLRPRLLFVDYTYLSLAFLGRRRYRTALLTLPFFWLRDLTWFVAFRAAMREQAQIAQDDAAFLASTSESVPVAQHRGPNPR